jgi:hypothetical protein
MTDKEDCIFFKINILGKKTCLLGHDWECETDATVCGDYTLEEEYNAAG